MILYLENLYRHVAASMKIKRNVRQVNSTDFVRVEILTATSVKSRVLCVVTSRCSGNAERLPPESDSLFCLLFDPEDGVDIFN
jgi:hypothetical protein